MIAPGLVEAVLVIVVTLAIAGLKKWQPVIEGNKWLLRFLCLLAAAAVAAYTDWLPDQKLTLATWFALFWPAVMGIEFSYQWVLKTISGMMPVKPNP